MKILLDNCVDWRLARSLPDHEVAHARELGWQALTNGRLLTAAEEDGFAVIVTVDKNFRFQQNPDGRSISVVTLSPVLVKLEELLPLIPQLNEVLAKLEAGSFTVIN
ncbi:DUF5615 family PIN-like protein [Fimbriimonas ginsengisoli]|uniref:DUF5615 domain-containing protein n=1 Tax=Fimbriimonas ginsengisoli Gsoil 348 TaxID=661478 RepID=A0A068NRN5_FIMGI|nr:DUF5615 family PIN-like protein [Fimbriimonas ginsengisoli]AIE85430.1 hypothetical protein OP10G_2062 [Fimbriimonas ginsengisoli Gsoil 348]